MFLYPQGIRTLSPLSVSKNKIIIENMVREMVIANGAKETVASVLFETPTEVRVKDLTEVEMRLLECDHERADTPLLIYILMSSYSYIIVHCCDTETIHYSAYQLFKAESQGKNCVFKKEDWIFEYFSYC